MDMTFEDQIRERAYQIWQAAGMADGQAHEHWVSAEQAVRGEVATVAVEPEVILTKAAPRKAPAAKSASAKTVKAKAPAAPKASRAKAKKVVEATAH